MKKFLTIFGLIFLGTLIGSASKWAESAMAEKPRSKVELIVSIPREYVGNYTCYIVRIDNKEYIINPQGGILEHK